MRFQWFQVFQSFQSVARQNYRRTSYFANGQARLFWIIERFLASNWLR